jgi:hypothetical protein
MVVKGVGGHLRGRRDGPDFRHGASVARGGGGRRTRSASKCSSWMLPLNDRRGRDEIVRLIVLTGLGDWAEKASRPP